jgi:cadmium resistance protein CadD (predicted permease)
LFALFGLAIALFVSTNIDNVFVLVGFFSDPKFRTRDIVIGQYAGIAALFGISVLASLLSLVIPRAYIGLLGIAPILIGAKKFLELYRRREKTEETLQRHASPKPNGRPATVALVTFANGGDNVGTYAPSFALRSPFQITVIGLVFVGMTALWCFAAHSMVNHPKLGTPIRRFGHRVTPIVLIAFGILILQQAGTFGWLFRHAGP